MARIVVINGWKESPHQWWRFILLPVTTENNPMWFSIGLFGFAFCFLKGE